MHTKGILTLLRTPDLGSALLLQRDLHGLLRVHFLYAAFDSWLLQTLRTPPTLK